MDASGWLDRLPEAVVIVDTDGKVQAHNDRAVTLLGLPGDAAGRHVDDLLDLRDDGGSRVGLPARPPLGERVPEQVLWVGLPGGRRRPVSLCGRWSDDALVLTFRHAGRREQIDARRGDVVATVSHEIRSPLTSVKGFTRTMLARWDRFSDAQKRAMLETIDHDADRVTRLLRELLDVSRIDAGRVELHRAPTDVGKVVADAVDKVRYQPDAADRDFVLRVDDDIPQLTVDADKVEQVVLNLLDNALRYAPDSQVQVEVTATADKGIRIAVADEGPGIAPEQRDVVFRKFGRGRGTRLAGTGLGLYISRGLIAAHGGTVSLDPDHNPGARFVVELPADA